MAVRPTPSAADAIGDPAALIFGLFVVIIREVTRRSDRGRQSIFLLAAAFGVIQAGLLDQSLFNPHYRSIDY